MNRYSLQLTEKLSITKIQMDEKVHARSKLDHAVVSEYSDAMRRGAKFPPITVFYDGSKYWLADGFHRVKAREANGDCKILADVELGSRREAKLYAIEANVNHGLLRNDADMRKAIRKLMSDSEWRQWSDQKIARHCGVDHKTVAEYRQKILRSMYPPDLSGEFPQRENAMNGLQL